MRQQFMQYMLINILVEKFFKIIKILKGLVDMIN